MQKFPLRMKDNDLLVTELYTDPSEDMVTSLSVYLTPKTSKCYHGNNVIQISFIHYIYTLKCLPNIKQVCAAMITDLYNDSAEYMITVIGIYKVHKSSTFCNCWNIKIDSLIRSKPKLRLVSVYIFLKKKKCSAIEI